MMVKVKTNFLGQPELDIENPTLKEILLELSKRINVSIVDPVNDEIRGDFKVYVNGVEQEGLGYGIDTKIEDKDEVEVTLVVLSGG